jgi:hypothetical protein
VNWKPLIFGSYVPAGFDDVHPILRPTGLPQPPPWIDVVTDMRLEMKKNQD